MSDLSRRLKKISTEFEEFKKSSGVDYTDLSEEERDSIKIDILITAAKAKRLLPIDYENPVCELARQVRDKLKQHDEIYYPRLSKDERLKRISRLRDMVCSDDGMKTLWECHIKGIAYPFERQRIP